MDYSYTSKNRYSIPDYTHDLELYKKNDNCIFQASLNQKLTQSLKYLDEQDNVLEKYKKNIKTSCKKQEKMYRRVHRKLRKYNSFYSKNNMLTIYSSDFESSDYEKVYFSYNFLKKRKSFLKKKKIDLDLKSVKRKDFSIIKYTNNDFRFSEDCKPIKKKLKVLTIFT